MARIGSVKIWVSIVVIIGVIAVVSIGFVHQKINRIETMITAKRSDVDSDINAEKENIRSPNWFDVAQIIPESDTRVNSMMKMKGSEESGRITVLENMVRTLLREQEKWMPVVDWRSKQDKNPARDMRYKRAVDDIELDDLNKTKDTYENRDRLHTDIGSAVYIRWERSLCPKETKLVNDGVTAGSHFDLQGSAVNKLCLPNDPVWGKYGDRISNYSLIFGAEYRLYSGEHLSLFKLENAKKLHMHNVPCALCKSQTRTSVFMLPGRNICYKGWHKEYHGYLTGPYNTNKSPSDYICVDEAPEADPAGYRDEGGKLLLPVEAVCGSLPCPPYVAGRELTCAVCSK
ncbi:hypothetical protein CHS0354_022105 [Potamilus streckersoni]|uniref:Short-chain collagen C4 n=1 Tax=Potamilus streckersoni TaxID=2493646 RepID=A0AAE0VJD7_9BIVA|nr:hypothetical protein CHS0354_022105 [Potamilus streckersoni]